MDGDTLKMNQEYKMDVQQHELYAYYLPEAGSDLYEAMQAELEAVFQRNMAQQVLQGHTQELRILMGRFKQFNSRTSIEEVMQAQRRAEALRWLITCIEREIREWDEVCGSKSREVRLIAQQQYGSLIRAPQEMELIGYAKRPIPALATV